jgi:hypothetical protein
VNRCEPLTMKQLGKLRWAGPQHEAAVRFEQHTIRTDGCWHWIGHCSLGGYGRFRSGGKKIAAHRWSYEHFVGQIPAGLTLDHLCNNPACVNPSHLEPVPMKVNILRGSCPAANNARMTSCKRGHPLSMNPNGVRYCQACQRDGLRRRRRAARLARVLGEGGTQ